MTRAILSSSAARKRHRDLMIPKQQHKIAGTGFFSDAWDWLKRKTKPVVQIVQNPARFINHVLTKNAYKDSVTQLLSEVGHNPVTRIRVGRLPVQGAITSIFDALTLGNFSKLTNQSGIQTLYHLYSIVTLGGNSGGKDYVVEKNANVNFAEISGGNSQPLYGDTIEITLPNQNMEIGTMLTNTRTQMGEDKYFQYDAFNNNCQDFLIAFLSSNKLLTEENSRFVKQDVRKVADQLPDYLKKIANAATDLGHVVGAGEDVGLSNTEIEQKARTLRIPGFAGCFSKDNMVRLRDGQCAVINIQDSVDENGQQLPGTHWVAAGVKNGQAWYFDSFGLGVPISVGRHLPKPIFHLGQQIQSETSTKCGLFSLASCRLVQTSPTPAPKTLEDYIEKFNVPNLQLNDARVKKFLENHTMHHSSSGLNYTYQNNELGNR